MKKIILSIFIMSFISAAAQTNNIAQFAVWKPKEGLTQKFESGYKQHLKWHKDNNDTWSWYGWYITSGSRAGQFVDATFDHYWSDFDSPVKPAEDRADNLLNVYPFAELQSVFKVNFLKDISILDTSGLKSKFLRFVTLSVNDIPQTIKIINELKNKYYKEGLVKNIFAYKMIDGGNINQVLLIFGFNNYLDFGSTENLQSDISIIERTFKMKLINSINSETLVYRGDMSLFPE